MTNDPYREPSGLGGPPSGDSGAEPPRPDTTWMPPADPTAPDQPPPQPYQTPAYPAPGGPPAGEASPYQAPAGPPYPAPPAGYPGARRPTNGLAIAALVCSLAGVLTLISAPVGAVLGHLAIRQIAQTGEEGAPLAKAAIWVGWVITGLVAIACCAVLAFGIVASRSTEFGPS